MPNWSKFCIKLDCGKSFESNEKPPYQTQIEQERAYLVTIKLPQ